MLDIHDGGPVSRRTALKVGSLALGGLSLASVSQALGQDASAISKGKSVVLIFMSGGASHIETFDPKPQAPLEYRSMTGAIPTAIPGVAFGGTFPGLAARADRLAIVRSFSHSVGNHEQAIAHMMASGNALNAGLGAVAARLRGSNHPETGMPMHVHLAEDEVDPQYNRERSRMLAGDGPGLLGSAYAPFLPGGKGPLNENLQLRLPAERFGDRRSLLSELDRLHRQTETAQTLGGVDEYRQQAYQLILGQAREAFDLKKEDPRVVERYETTRYKVGFKKFRPSTIGHQLLTARRLIEAGCGFVTIQSPGWDMHADGNNPGILKGMPMLGTPLDHALSVFLDDLADRGMTDDVLVILTGDFGRTPRINNRGGRDHWPGLGTLALAGGGLRCGQVVGTSTRLAEKPDTRPLGPDNLLATVMHTLFDVGQLRLRTDLPREVKRVIEQGEPIGELLG